VQVTHGDILKSLRELLKKYSDIHLIAHTKECEANGTENIYAKSAEGDERGRLREVCANQLQKSSFSGFDLIDPPSPFCECPAFARALSHDLTTAVCFWYSPQRWDDAKPLTWSESEIQLLDMNRCKQIVHAIENSCVPNHSPQTSMPDSH